MMKVLLVNGSPNKEGCTFTALTEVAGAIQKNGIETEIFHHREKAGPRLYRVRTLRGDRTLHV